jgi:hypothetical protein
LEASQTTQKEHACPLARADFLNASECAKATRLLFDVDAYADNVGARAKEKDDQSTGLAEILNRVLYEQTTLLQGLRAVL